MAVDVRHGLKLLPIRRFCRIFCAFGPPATALLDFAALLRLDERYSDYWIFPPWDGSLSFNSSIDNGGGYRPAARPSGFHNVVETRNFSATARSLGVSTSAIAPRCCGSSRSSRYGF